MSKGKSSGPNGGLSRSEIMRRVPQRDTKPELIVRRALHALGYRFRVHRKDLPGSPDIVLPRYRLCIFVHGCFWHRHDGCRLTTTPATNEDFWRKKFEANMRRDREASDSLRAHGWRVALVWECETRNAELLNERLKTIISACSQ
jgi:DNA mismatch endonuclease (patch repair protein)